MTPHPKIDYARRLAISPSKSVNLVVIGLLAMGYLAFVEFFGVTGLQRADEWSILTYYQALENGTLSFSMLWEPAAGIHRVLIPNLLYLADAKLNHLDTKTLMFFSSLSYIIAFVAVLKAFTDAYSVKLNTWVVLLVGLIWFSLITHQIALWGAGIGNYLIIFFLCTVLYLFSRDRLSTSIFLCATLVAILASFTLFTGLLLWPIGLLCLVWRKWKCNISRLWILSWFILACLVFYLYFSGLNYGAMPKSTSPVRAILHFPSETLKFFMILLSGVFPPFSSSFDLSYGRFVIGSFVFIVFVTVVVMDLFTSRNQKIIPVASCLVLFGLICDVETACGRVYQGYQIALTSRYALPNIVAIVGCILFAVSFSTSKRTVTPLASKKRVLIYLSFLTGLLFCLIQIATSMTFGIQQAGLEKTDQEMSNRTFANLDLISDGDQRFALLVRYGSPFSTNWGGLVPIAQKYHLGVFYFPELAKYRELGPPPLIPDVPFLFPIKPTKPQS